MNDENSKPARKENVGMYTYKQVSNNKILHTGKLIKSK